MASAILKHLHQESPVAPKGTGDIQVHYYGRDFENPEEEAQDEFVRSCFE
jgi:hypothetical protein